MKINWKKVAASPGYKSLKAAYIKDVQEFQQYEGRFGQKPMRDKEDFLRKFKWVIGRAMHYAYATESSIEFILNHWEEKRNYWWLNYYQDSHQPKYYTHNRYRKRSP